MECAVLFKVLRLISTHVCLQPQPCFWGSTTLTASSYEPRYRDQFRLGLTEKFQPGFRDGLKANDPGDEFWQEGTNKADMRNIEITSWKARAYGIFTRVGEVSEIERVSAANEWDFWYKTNECENPVQSAFHAVICLFYTYWDFFIYPALIGSLK